MTFPWSETYLFKYSKFDKYTGVKMYTEKEVIGVHAADRYVTKMRKDGWRFDEWIVVNKPEEPECQPKTASEWLLIIFLVSATVLSVTLCLSR